MIFDDRGLFDRQIASLTGEKFELIIRKQRLPITNEQLKFYIGIVLKEAHRHDEFIHYDKPKDIHDKVMALLFLAEYIVVEGKLKTKIKKLEELNKDEMWELTERVIAYLLTEFGIEIADKKHYHIK